jgi:molybdenum cofactor cytidylyltransferase
MIDQSKIGNRKSKIVSGILLAAGRSSRMGRPKQLLLWHGIPLVRHAAQTALDSQLSELIVVVGYESSRVRAALADLPVRIVQNDSYEAGQGSSLRAGIEAVRHESQAAMIMLVDQPLLQAATIDALIAAWQPPALIVAPSYMSRRGNPVLFARALFGALSNIDGDFGARNVIKAQSSALTLVEVADAGVLIDMDTPDMYRRLSERGGDEQE